MYKCELQELCQRRGWDLPEYAAVKEGPEHDPLFAVTVTVAGQAFEAPKQRRSVKPAQNAAARVALRHFKSPPPPPPPLLPEASQPFSGAASHLDVVVPDADDDPVLPSVPCDAVIASVGPDPVHAATEVEIVSPPPSSLPFPPAGLLLAKNDTNFNKTSIDSHDMLHLYKSGLELYARKKNLSFPMYTCEAEGPPHDRRFKSKVSIGGKSYEAVEYFPTIKGAEQAAAKVACHMLHVDVIQEDAHRYKYLLQVLTRKLGLSCPSYETVSSGSPHRPKFVSYVEVENNTYQGPEAKTKKEAVMNAAKVAYFTIAETGFAVTKSSSVTSSMGCAAVDHKEQIIKLSAIIENKMDQDSTGKGDVGSTPA